MYLFCVQLLQYFVSTMFKITKDAIIDAIKTTRLHPLLNCEFVTISSIISICSCGLFLLSIQLNQTDKIASADPMGDESVLNNASCYTESSSSFITTIYIFIVPTKDLQLAYWYKMQEYGFIAQHSCSE